MDLLLGQGHLAEALARGWSQPDGLILASTTPTSGPFLWRRADPSTGEGIRAALQLADRLVLVLDRLDAAPGFFALVKPGMVGRAVVVAPPGGTLPKGLDALADWSQLRVGPTWGPMHPWVRAWAREARAGRPLWVPDLGPVPVVPTATVLHAIEAALGRRGCRWTLGPVGEARLPTLLGRSPTPVRRTPKALAAWRVGLDATALDQLAAAPRPTTDTPGWSNDAEASPDLAALVAPAFGS